METMTKTFVLSPRKKYDVEISIKDEVKDVKVKVAEKFQVSPSDLSFDIHPLNDNDIFLQNSFVKGHRMIIIKISSNANHNSSPNQDFTRITELYKPDSSLEPTQADINKGIEVLSDIFPKQTKETIRSFLEAAMYNIDLAIEYLLDPEKIPSAKKARATLSSTLNIRNKRHAATFTGIQRISAFSSKEDELNISKLVKITNQPQPFVAQMYTLLKEQYRYKFHSILLIISK